MTRTAIRNGRLLLTAGCAVAAIVAAGALRADLMVGHGFGAMFGSQDAATTFEAASRIEPQPTAQVGNEGYWLTRAEAESPVPFAKQLVVGDRITIAGRDGRKRILEVVDLSPLGEPLAKAVTGKTSAGLLLVTCRVLGDTDREAGAPVRFIVEAEAPQPPAVERTAVPKVL